MFEVAKVLYVHEVCSCCGKSLGEYTLDVEILQSTEFYPKYHYVQDIVEAALSGSTEVDASEKYSFGDTSDWWDDATLPDATPTHSVTVQVSSRYCDNSY